MTEDEHALEANETDINYTNEDISVNVDQHKIISEEEQESLSNDLNIILIWIFIISLEIGQIYSSGIDILI